MSVKVMGWVFDQNMKPTEKLVLLALADHADHEGRNIYPSISSISKKTGLSERAVHYSIKRLQKAGIIKSTGFTQYGTHNWAICMGGATDAPGAIDAGVQEMQFGGATDAPKPSFNRPGSKGNKDSNGVKQEEGVKGAKAPRPKAEPDPRGKHPAIVAIRDITNRFPPTGAWDKIIRIIGENPNTAKLKSNYETWCERGYNRNSVIWATEWYVNGAPKSKSALETFATEYR